MARGSRSKGPGRDTFDVANDWSLPGSTASPRASVSLIPVQDRRQFHPERGDSPALTFAGKPARLVVPPVKHGKSARGDARAMFTNRAQTKVRVSFDKPDQVLVCVRRKTRKEVLLALGRGGRSGRKPRRSWRSNISCR